MNLYKDAERLIEDFFENFEMRIAPKASCDEVAVQRVKETLAHYLEFTGDEADKLDRSELESIFRAALTDFLYEVYFTLEEPGPQEEALEPLGDQEWEDDDLDLDLDEDDAELEGDFYEILTLEEIVGLLREDPEGHADCDCLARKALEACAHENPRSVAELLETLVESLRGRKRTMALREILAQSHLALGEVHIRGGDIARGLAAFRQSARSHGRFPLAYERIAATHLGRGEVDAAIAAWRDQIRVAPDDPQPYLASAQVLESQGKQALAVDALNALLQVDADNALALDVLVRLAEETGRLEDAQSLRERILELRPPRRLEDIAVWVKHHLDAGNFDPILEHLHKEELDSPGQSLLNLLKALVFLAKDDPDNLEVELLLLRDKLDGQAEILADSLADLERLFGGPRLEPLRRAISEHVTAAPLD